MTLKEQCQKTESIMAVIYSLGRYPTDDEFQNICGAYGVPAYRYKRIFFAQINLHIRIY